ncbi:hypothetical protein [Rhodococcus kronopolitis]|uniref:Uncharacterized protein n=1 Tax=Rhodococcus kronopolitis TaxID=1460226 RepID=A0ABV9FNG3_9NOCA
MKAFSTRILTRAGAVAAVAAAAAIAGPAIGSAAVAGNVTVETDVNVIIARFHQVNSPTLVNCFADVRAESNGAVVARDIDVDINGAGAGVFATQYLPHGTYLLEAGCVDGSGTTLFTPVGGKVVDIVDEGTGSAGSSGSASGSAGSTGGFFGS